MSYLSLLCPSRCHPDPFSHRTRDLIFCRMLLTHLRDPLSVLERWGTQLRPRGFLLVEEVEWIQTEHVVLRRYLEIQATLLRQQANELYIGPRLEHYQGNARLTCRLSRVYPLPVSTAQAARLFALNLPSWKQHPFIQQQYGTIIDHVEHELQVLATTPSREGENMWGMRQLAYERASR